MDPTPDGAPMVLRIGLVSDTHGLLRPEAQAFLAGSDFIVHAGDVSARIVGLETGRTL